MAAPDKDTIYIDIDDEITGIIDKLKASSSKVVALVLPKRATVFQSIVNMKLLKRAADSSSKNVVLITSEAGLLPLAGAAGVHVAKTLNSKPEIPAAPQAIDDSDETIDEAAESETVDPNQTVGQLASTAPAGGVETLVMDDEDLPPEAAAAAGPKTFEPPAKGKKNKKFKIPDFNRFRLWLALGVLALVLLIGGIIFAIVALPKATIAIKTNATSLDASLDLNLSTTAKELDESENTLPAKLAQQQKTNSQQVPTTGQKNSGNKAQGSVNVNAGSCSGDVPSGIPSGTGMVSSNNQTYITQSSISFTPTVSGGKCVFQGIDDGGDNDIPIIAQSGGSSFNVPGNSSFKIPSRPEVSGKGSASGGTDNIVQTVNQNDINNAKAKLSANDDEMKQTLEGQLKKDKFYPITATFNAGTPAVTTSANVGEVANNVTVTQTVTYTMFGVIRNDLETLVENSIKDQIDITKRSILDDGIDEAVYNVDNLSATGARLAMTTTAAVGPDLDIDQIKQEAAGQKPGAVKDELGSNPDVEKVDVKLSPFWVSSIPKKTSRITIDIAKPTPAEKTNNTDDGQR